MPKRKAKTPKSAKRVTAKTKSVPFFDEHKHLKWLLPVLFAVVFSYLYVQRQLELQLSQIPEVSAQQLKVGTKASPSTLKVQPSPKPATLKKY